MLLFLVLEHFFGGYPIGAKDVVFLLFKNVLRLGNNHRMWKVRLVLRGNCQKRSVN